MVERSVVFLDIPLVYFSGVLSVYWFPDCLAWFSFHSHLAWPLLTELGPRSFATLFVVIPGSYLLCSIQLLAFGLCPFVFNMC